jgi:hypothetical protein
MVFARDYNVIDQSCRYLKVHRYGYQWLREWLHPSALLGTS